MTNERAELETSIRELASTGAREGRDALAMADLLLEIEHRVGRESVRTVVEAAGIDFSKAQRRAGLARKFSLGCPIPEPGLPFSFLRAIAATRDLTQWARRAIEERWTFAGLQRRLHQAGRAAP